MVWATSTRAGYCGIASSSLHLGARRPTFRICPLLFENYSGARAERGGRWFLPSPALLSCSLDPILREMSGTDGIREHSERSGYQLTLMEATPQCHVGEAGLILCPGDNARQTQLTLAGLPGQPFNRITGTAFAQHPCALGTHTRVRIEEAAGSCLAEQEFTLKHSEMRTIDLPFVPRDTPLALSLSVRLSNGVDSTTDAEVCFQHLRIEQTSA